MTSYSLLRTASTLSSAILALGLTTPAFAQSPNEELSRCQQLFSQWAKYNGGSAYAKQLTADTALEDCRKGNTTAGIAELKRVLQRASIPLPASETAAVK
jgi:hypothetical protein